MRQQRTNGQLTLGRVSTFLAGHCRPSNSEAAIAVYGTARVIDCGDALPLQPVRICHQ